MKMVINKCIYVTEDEFEEMLEKIVCPVGIHCVGVTCEDCPLNSNNLREYLESKVTIVPDEDSIPEGDYGY